MAHENLRHVPFTQLANLTGTPAMSVPLHIGESGLPLGSQFVGPPGGETLLFQLAAQIERAAPGSTACHELPAWTSDGRYQFSRCIQ